MSTMSNIATLLDTDWTRFDGVVGQHGYRHVSGHWIAREIPGRVGMTLESVSGGNGYWTMDAELHTIVHYVDMVEREQ